MTMALMLHLTDKLYIHIVYLSQIILTDTQKIFESFKLTDTYAVIGINVMQTKVNKIATYNTNHLTFNCNFDSNTLVLTFFHPHQN